MAGVEDEIEVGGIPLTRYLSGILRLNVQEQLIVKERVSQDLADSESLQMSSLHSGHSVASSRREAARVSSSNVSTIWEKREALIEVLTWNIAGTSADTRFRDEAVTLVSRVVGPRTDSGGSLIKKAPDVIVVGLQETISMTLDNVLSASRDGGDRRRIRRGAGAWPSSVTFCVDLLRQALDVADSKVDSEARGHFVLYGHPVSLFGLLLCVFCRSELVGTGINHFRAFELPVDKFETGAKGFVACRFALFHRSFCFINCHLSCQKANDEVNNLRSLQERCDQIKKCWREVRFKLSADEMFYPASVHRTVVLFGDTNMRLSLPRERLARQSFDSSVREQIVAGRWDALWELDQLRSLLSDNLRSHSKSRVSLPADWGKWMEPVPHNDAEPLSSCPYPSFPPTYRMAVPGPGYSSKRVPAFTDRVLLRSSDVKPLVYTSARQSDVFTPPRNISDHDPVFARFSVSCVEINTSVVSRIAQNLKSDRSSLVSIGECVVKTASAEPENLQVEPTTTFRNARELAFEDWKYDKDKIPPTATRLATHEIDLDVAKDRSAERSSRMMSALDEEHFREEIVQAFMPHIEQYAGRLSAVVNEVHYCKQCLLADTMPRLVAFSGECAEVCSAKLAERIRRAIADAAESASADSNNPAGNGEALEQALGDVADALREDLKLGANMISV
eukprot:TRINITY_DN6391_c0_g2_i1.p1 TRINITY_DN6391_c0_g2~~TRINITY_DN6391_c0_g2_i1.p1  ORF type:complete len:713 (-),score=92.29 TRINITY_DN6391_c0_g2_i1:50-2080(-)